MRVLDRLRDPQAAGAILTVGVGFFGGGASLWALTTAVDHRVAVAMMIFGAPVAIFGLVLLLIGPKKALSDGASPARQDVRQRGSNPRNAQQIARDKAVMVAGDYHDHGIGEQAAQRPTSQWFVANDDQTRGVPVKTGPNSSLTIWWQLEGWMFYRRSNRPSLTIRAYCSEHRTPFLINVRGTESYEEQNGVSSHSDSKALQCPLDRNIFFLWEDWGTHRSRAAALVDQAARDGGWRYPPGGDHDPDASGVFFV